MAPRKEPYTHPDFAIQRVISSFALEVWHAEKARGGSHAWLYVNLRLQTFTIVRSATPGFTMRSSFNWPFFFVLHPGGDAEVGTLRQQQ